MSVIAYTKRKFSIYNKEGIYEKEDYLELLDARLARYFDKKQLTAELPFTIIAEMNADEGYFSAQH
ncbi:MAG: hypothetical protein ACLT4X_09060 [Phascolarctobacterium sp.]